MRGSFRKLPVAVAALMVGGVVLLADSAALAPVEAASASLETQVRQVEDQLAIRKLLAQSDYYLDDRDLEKYASVFAKDGELYGGLGNAKTPGGILTLLQNAHLPPNSSGPDGHASVHVMTNFIIDVDGDKATALSKYTVLGTGGPNGAPRLLSAGHYRDRLVRKDGEWKFERRVIYGDIPPSDPMANKQGGTK